MDYQDKFRGYLGEVEEVGTKDKKEVVAEFLSYITLCMCEQVNTVMVVKESEELFKLVGEMRATNDLMTIIKDSTNPKPKGEQT